MRVGDINKDNYKVFQQLLNIKNTKPLDDLFDKDEDKVGKNLSYEELAAKLYASGDVLEGMLVRPGDVSWKKIVPVPDWIKKAVIDHIREVIITNHNGTRSTEDGDKGSAIKLDYIKTLPPSERLSASWTLGRIASAEDQRMDAHIKANFPDWKPGQSFDSSIFDDWKPGYELDENHLDIKA
ncbi:MAG: DUF3879 family protein [Chitinispirillales bacterium]|jgi:hypothetical protein|nr:DUF3879 family protein [Chitinispirillales bacterium]